MFGNLGKSLEKKLENWKTFGNLENFLEIWKKLKSW